MRFQRSDIFGSKNINSSNRLQNSSITSPFQSRHIKNIHEIQPYKVYTYKVQDQISREKVRNRCNLAIEYIPQLSVVRQSGEGITIKIKQYSMQLLPWLIKKEALFKVNIVLGMYVAFLELIDIYGIFPLHPNMMKVNQKQQVAIWINKNFQALDPDQVLTRNAFSIREFIKSFLRIFRCCLPNKSTSDMYNDAKDLLNDLTKIKRKQEMHKNCHEFIKHNNKLGSSRKSNKFQSTSIIQSLKEIPELQRYSTRQHFSPSKSPFNDKARFSSFSPPKRIQRNQTSLQKINQTAGFKHNPSASFGSGFFKKKNSVLQNDKSIQIRTQNTKQPSICSTGQLFKRYLMYNTSKYQKMNKVSTPPVYLGNSVDRFPKDFIFRSEVYKQNQNAYSQKIIEERNSVQVMSQQILGVDEDLFSPVKFRKMSSNTNEKQTETQKQKKFTNSTGWKKSFREQENFFFSTVDHDENGKTEPKQKLKSSFPYKTASTIHSFRLSNQHQYHMFPSKSQQNLNACGLQSLTSLNQKQKDKKIEDMKIVEEHELQNQLNNIFSMENSDLRKQEDDKKMEIIITQFQQVLF